MGRMRLHCPDCKFIAKSNDYSSDKANFSACIGILLFHGKMQHGISPEVQFMMWFGITPLELGINLR